MRRNKTRHSAWFLLALLLGCSSSKLPAFNEDLGPSKAGDAGKTPGRTADGGAVVGGQVGTNDPGSSLGAAQQPHLQWKRYASFQADLASAFELAPADLCTEFGTQPCIEAVHLVPLGGHEPFTTGMLEPAAEPLATTPTVVERIVLSVCTKRVALDRDLGKTQAKVFTQFDLTVAAPSADAASVKELATTLYRRLLSRDPADNEVALLSKLSVDDAGQAVSAADFAKLACFVVGTSTEFLFF